MSCSGGGRCSRLGYFTVDNLHTILRNKAYVGVRVYKSKGEVKETKAVWLAIVDHITFERVQKKLTKNFNRKKPCSPSRYPYLLTGLTYCAQCGDSMCGKSAHGNGGKVPYYEHSWAMRKSAALVKNVFKCEPTRVSGRLLEAAVWEKVEQLLSGQKLSSEILKEAKAIYQKQKKSSESDDQKEKIKVLDSKIEALAERLTQLPKTVSAVPIFKQMEKLESLKKLEEQVLLNLPQSRGFRDLPAELVDYETFIRGLQKLKIANEETRQKIIERLIYKIEVKPDGFIVHYHAGQQQIKRESEKSGSLALIKFNGSTSLTNGDRGTTRTCDLRSSDVLSETRTQR